MNKIVIELSPKEKELYNKRIFFQRWKFLLLYFYRNFEFEFLSFFFQFRWSSEKKNSPTKVRKRRRSFRLESRISDEICIRKTLHYFNPIKWEEEFGTSILKIFLIWKILPSFLNIWENIFFPGKEYIISKS